MITCFFYAYLRPGNNSIPLKTCPYNPGQFLVFKNKMCVKNECVERLNERHFSLLFVTLKLIPRRHWTGPGCSNVGRSCHWRIETVRGDLRKNKMFWTLWVSVWSKHKGGLGPNASPSPLYANGCYSDAIYITVSFDFHHLWLKATKIGSVDISGQFLVEKWMCK